MKVYRSNRGSCIHFDPECPSRSRTNRATTPLQEYSLTELTPRRFCTTCSPSELLKMPKTVHRVCETCAQTEPKPCAHNGGVQIYNSKAYRWNGKVTPFVEKRWVWPEYAFGRSRVGVDAPPSPGLRSGSSTA